MAEEVQDLVHALLVAGKTVFEIVEAAVQSGYQLVKKIVAALEAAFNLAHDALITVLKAIDQLGRTLGELISFLATKAYDVVKRGIEALLEIGKTVGNILAQALSFGVILLTNTVKALIELGHTALEILQTAITRPGSLFTQIVQSLTNLGRSLASLFDEVINAGADLVKAIASTAASIGTTLVEFASYIVQTGIEVATKIVDGLIAAGKTLLDVIITVAQQSVAAIKKVVDAAFRLGKALIDVLRDVASIAMDLFKQVVKAALEFGATLGQLIAETVKHPDQARENLLAAFEAAGKTLQDIYQAALVETAEQFLEQVTLAQRDLGKAVVEIFEAVLEVAGGALATAVSILLRTLSSYRPLTAQEKDDARIVYGNSLNLDNVYVSMESLTNDIIFGIQDFFTDNPESRAFVTDNLINFDVDDGAIKRHTLIHELCHVWQFDVTGPFYMSEAIHAQVAGDGYNYGYTEGVASVTIPVDYAGTTESLDRGDVTGEGGQDDLQAAAGDFEQFNREQQGQIAMHYYVRRVLLNRPASDYAPWQPYIDAIQARVA